MSKVPEATSIGDIVLPGGNEWLSLRRFIASEGAAQVILQTAVTTMPTDLQTKRYATAAAMEVEVGRADSFERSSDVSVARLNASIGQARQERTKSRGEQGELQRWVSFISTAALLGVRRVVGEESAEVEQYDRVARLGQLPFTEVRLFSHVQYSISNNLVVHRTSAGERGWVEFPNGFIEVDLTKQLNLKLFTGLFSFLDRAAMESSISVGYLERLTGLIRDLKGY